VNEKVASSGKINLLTKGIIMLNVKIEEKNGVKIVNLGGELNVKTAPDFEKYFDEFEGGKVILNVEKLDYISSAGLRSLVILIKKLYATKGEMVLVNMQGVVREIIEVSGFENLFKVFDSLEKADTYFQK
jgi:anti-anti-sigma factor